MIEPPKKNTCVASRRPEFNLDFEALLPDWDGFPVWWLAKRWLAKRWRLSDSHWLRLLDDGDLKACVDLRRSGSSRSVIRITRAALLEFFHRRKDLPAVAAANPRPLYREESKRKPERGNEFARRGLPRK